MRVVYGGTFDPVHVGHLAVAEHLVPALNPSVFLYLPCCVPVHKAEPTTGTHHRLTMLAIGIQALPDTVKARCAIDDREAHSGVGHYTVDTLTAMRAEGPRQESLVFVMGGDSLHQLASWHRWTELTDLAHLVVVGRPGFSLTEVPDSVQRFLSPAMTDDWSSLARSAHGKVMLLPEFDVPISSTLLTHDVKSHNNWLVPAVYDYILAQHLYNSGL